MRIGIFDPYLDTLGGGEKYMLMAASCLSKNGHEVFIFWDLSSRETIIKGARERFGLDISSITFTKNIFSNNTSFLTRLLESRKYDTIFYLSDGSMPLVLSKNLIVHFQFPVEWVKNNLRMRLKLSRVCKVICNSKFTRQFIDRKFQIKSLVLYPPSNEGKFESVVSKEKKNIILTVGRFNKITNGSTFKKHEIMIDTFKKMVKKGIKRWEFIIVISHREDEESEVERLEKQSEGFPVQILTNVSKSTLDKLYDISKIYWHAAGFGEDLEKMPQRAEHFGISTVEAMSAGVVPVVINAGGQKEIVEDGKNGLLWNTLEDLQDKTLKVISDFSLWQNLSKNARQRAKFFSQESFCEELEKIIA